MSHAPNYSPTASFAADETNQVAGRSTVKTVSVDTELANISASINALNTNIKLLQRDDGKVKDLLIEPFMLSEQSRALVSTGGVPRGDWVAATAYAVKDVVQNAGFAYICHTAHTSGSVFDEALWIPISGDGSSSASAIAAAASAVLADADRVSAEAAAATATAQAVIATAQAVISTAQAVSATNSASAASANKIATDSNVTATANSATAASGSATSASTSAATATTKAGEAAASAAAAATLAAGAAITGMLYKVDPLTPAFTKTAAGALSIKAGTKVDVAGTVVTFASNTAITMPSLTGGTDYAIWVKDNATIEATTDFVSPPGAGNWRKIGGFHYGLVAAGTTVASGSFATTGNGKIWVQGDVDDIAGINKYSIWDLKFRPAAADPRGMALVGGQVWVDIYLCSTDTAANGTSKAGSNIASHTVLPKIPAAFDGNGSTTYPSLNWWVANELARANQKRLMHAHEFYEAAFGVTENQSIDATASTYPTTQRNAGYTSKYGIEQASGHHWTWGQDSNFYSEVASPAGSYKTVNGNTGAAGSERGSEYTFGTYGLARVILGGARSFGAYSGSRASNWYNYPWYSNWSIGLRAACDHLISV